MATDQGRGLHLTGLNGLRAIAALAVVVSHLNHALPEFGLPRGTSSKLAEYGVTIFFALSGFLITYLLLLERTQSRIDIKKFYIRRILRIWPLYYVNLFVVVALLYSRTPDVLPGSLPFYVLLSANLPFAFGTALVGLEHYWSLGVEEQFYLFWPWLVRRFHNPLRPILVFTVAYVALRSALRLLPATSGLPYLLMFVTRFDCMAIGAIGAILYARRTPWFYRFAQHRLVQVVSWFVVGLLLANRFFVPLVGHDAIAIVTVCIIVAQVTRTNRLISLENRPAEFLGKISYGIYVLHPLVITCCAAILPSSAPTPAKYALVYGVVIGTTVLLAHLSYVTLERPFLRRKERYAIVRTQAAVR